MWGLKMYYEKMTLEDQRLCEVAYRAGLRVALLEILEDGVKEWCAVLAVAAVEFQLRVNLNPKQIIVPLDFVCTYLDAE